MPTPIASHHDAAARSCRRASGRVRPGISLVEMLMSVSVLSVTALGVFQIMAFTETKMIKARNELTVRQGEEIALTYIYDDFLDAALVDTT